jgi:hypothetical protein
MINVTNELRDTHKKISQRGIHGRNYWKIHGEATRHG